MGPQWPFVPGEAMLAYFDTIIGWKELLARTYRETMKDDAQGLAAQLAYYFFLALFPALLCVIAFASLFPLQNFTDQVTRTLQPFAPADVIDIIRTQMLKLANSKDGGLLSLGLLGAIWSSSAAMVAVVSAMNRAYDITDSRPWWKVRVVAILLTVGLALFIVISFTLVVAGPQLAETIAGHFGLGPVFVWTWKIVQWPVVFFLVAVGVGMVYYFAPDAEQDWVWITPGSLLATLLWLAGSLAFRFYAVHFGNYDATYGAIGGIIALMLWFYLSGLIIVIGAEMNAEIEHNSPWGKAAGEKVPGEKRKIGTAAARAYHEKARHRPPQAGHPDPPRPAHDDSGVVERLASYIALLAHWRSRSKS
jgi:membrane protein